MTWSRAYFTIERRCMAAEMDGKHDEASELMGWAILILDLREALA